MVPDDVNFNSSKKLYPLEKVTDKDGCTLERNNKLRHDPRYQRISGFNISEYQILKDNGIIDLLENLPNYTQPDGTSIYDISKKNNKLGLYVRSTIPWKLSCEQNATNPMTRDMAYKIYTQQFVYTASSGKMALLSFIFMAVTLFTFFLYMIHDCLTETGLLRYRIIQIIRELLLVAVAICAIYIFDAVENDVNKSLTQLENAK